MAKSLMTDNYSYSHFVTLKTVLVTVLLVAYSKLRIPFVNVYWLTKWRVKKKIIN